MCEDRTLNVRFGNKKKRPLKLYKDRGNCGLQHLRILLGAL